jgi:hypothetical protein
MFDDYSVSIDEDCLYQDFDDIDLYGDKIIEEDTDNFGSNLQLD